jgi:hypothetical protein
MGGSLVKLLGGQSGPHQREGLRRDEELAGSGIGKRLTMGKYYGL